MNKMSQAGSAGVFRCPRYEELPDISLYLDQVLTTVNQALAPLACEAVTGAVISNYVKNGAVPPPEKKKYRRDHLVYILVITILKKIFTIQQVARFFEIQQKTYPLPVAYNFFCSELENALKEAFDFTGMPLPVIETVRTPQTILVRSVVLSVANKVYVEQKFLSESSDGTGRSRGQGETALI